MKITFSLGYDRNRYEIGVRSYKGSYLSKSGLTFLEIKNTILDAFRKRLCKGDNYEISISAEAKKILGNDKTWVLEDIVRIQNILTNPKKRPAKLETSV